MTGIMQMIASSRIVSTASAAPYATLVYDLDAANFSSAPVTGNLDATGTYSLTVTNAGSISWKSASGGYFEKNNAVGTDTIIGGPNYAISQSYTVFAAYQADSRSGGRMLNTASEAVSDWAGLAYASGTLYKNVFFPNGTVNLNSDSYVGNSGWNFLWGLYNTTTGWGNLYIAASGVNNTVGPTAAYKFVNVGTGNTHGFNQLRLWSRSGGGEVQTGNVGFVKVYSGITPLAQIQELWANLHSRFGI